MKRTIIVIISCLLLFIGCKKDNTDPGKEKNNKTSKEENVTQYIKSWGAYAYANEEDLGKDKNEVSDKKYFYFGSKFTVLKTTDINGKSYSRIQLPDKTEYWIEKDALAEKFIVINQEDVMGYSQPDPDYASQIHLQPGDLGVFVKEMDGWINVDFLAYREKGTSDAKQFVGTLWIKDGYTEDLKAAKEGYYLYLAYYRQIFKNDTDKAIEMVEKALEANGGVETEVTYVVKNYLDELQTIKATKE